MNCRATSCVLLARTGVGEPVQVFPGRYGSHEQVTFDFLGYTFKPRAAKKKEP